MEPQDQPLVNQSGQETQEIRSFFKSKLKKGRLFYVLALVLCVGLIIGLFIIKIAPSNIIINTDITPTKLNPTTWPTNSTIQESQTNSDLSNNSGVLKTNIDTANWNTYSNPQIGASFKYPPKWKVDEASQGENYPDLITISSEDYKEEGLDTLGIRIYLSREQIWGKPENNSSLEESTSILWQGTNSLFYIMNTGEGRVAVISSNQAKPFQEIYTLFSNTSEFNSYREIFLEIASSISIF